MRESSKAALCGITSALAVVVMLSTYISPFLVYTAPAFAGILLLLIYNEIGVRWCFATYISISLLSIFVIADKESAVFFTLLFGYFPMLSCIINNTKLNKFVKFLIKLLIFNISCLISLLLCTFVLGIDDDAFSEGIVYVVLFAVLLNVLFVVYDILLSRLQLIYKLKLQKKFRKLFSSDRKG